MNALDCCELAILPGIWSSYERGTNRHSGSLQATDHPLVHDNDTMDNKTDDMIANSALVNPHLLVKSELTDERLGQETLETIQDPTTSAVIKQEEDMFEEKSGVDLPSFGVDIQPSEPVNTKVEILNDCVAQQPVPRMADPGKHTEIAGFPIQHAAGYSAPETAAVTWRSQVSREERAHRIAVLYNLLKQKYPKNIDAKLKDQLVILARRVENAWFHKAEGKVCCT